MHVHVISRDPTGVAPLQAALRAISIESSCVPTLADIVSVPGDRLLLAVEDVTLSSKTLVMSAHKLGFSNIVIVADSCSQEWEEVLYSLGVRAVLVRPNPRLLANLFLNEPQAAAMTQQACEQVGSHRDTTKLVTVGKSIRLGLMQTFPEEHLRALKEALGITRIAFYQVSGDLLTYHCSIGFDPSCRANIPLNRGLGQEVRVRGTTLDIRCSSAVITEQLRQLGAEMVIPVRCESRLLGVLFLGPSVCGSRLSDDEIRALYCIMEDFGRLHSQVHQHDSDLQEARALGKLFDGLEQAFMVVDRELTISKANRAMCSLLGTDQPVYRNLPSQLASAIFGLFGSQDKQATVSYSQGTALFRAQLNLCSSSGSMVVWLTDVTATTAKEERAIQQAKEETLMAVSRQFSHIFNNAISETHAIAQQLPERLGDPEFLKLIATNLPRTVHRITNAVSRLYTLATPGNPTASTLMLSKVVQRAAAELELTKRVKVTGLDVYVRAPEIWLAMIFQELLLNASLATDAGEILVTGTEMSGKVKVDIHDDGPGYTLEDLAAFKSDLPAESIRGLGIGLLLVRRLVTALGGQVVCAQSEQKKGAITTIMLAITQ